MLLAAALAQRARWIRRAKLGNEAILGGKLDFADFDGERHSARRACRQAACDGLPDIVQRLGLGSPLRDAAGNRRALGAEHPVLSGSSVTRSFIHGCCRVRGHSAKCVDYENSAAR